MKTNILFSRKYLIPLGLLLVNDFVLKFSFPGFITGKISDLAGIYCFLIFSFVLFPRFVGLLSLLVSISFLYWKTELSNGLIELFSLYRVPLGRTVDYSDLFCLVVVPLAIYEYKNNTNRLEVPKYKFLICSIVSLFAFSASPASPNLTEEQEEYLDKLRTVWPSRVQNLNLTGQGRTYFVPGISKEKYFDFLKSKNYLILEFPDGKRVHVNKRGEPPDWPGGICRIDGFALALDHKYSDSELQNIKDNLPFFDVINFSEIKESINGLIFHVSAVQFCVSKDADYTDEAIASLFEEEFIRGVSK